MTIAPATTVTRTDAVVEAADDLVPRRLLDLAASLANSAVVECLAGDWASVDTVLDAAAGLGVLEGLYVFSYQRCEQLLELLAVAGCHAVTDVTDLRGVLLSRGGAGQLQPAYDRGTGHLVAGTAAADLHPEGERFDIGAEIFVWGLHLADLLHHVVDHAHGPVEGTRRAALVDELMVDLWGTDGFLPLHGQALPPDPEPAAAYTSPARVRRTPPQPGATLRLEVTLLSGGPCDFAGLPTEERVAVLEAGPSATLQQLLWGTLDAFGLDDPRHLAEFSCNAARATTRGGTLPQGPGVTVWPVLDLDAEETRPVAELLGAGDVGYLRFDFDANWDWQVRVVAADPSAEPGPLPVQVTHVPALEFVQYPAEGGPVTVRRPLT